MVTYTLEGEKLICSFSGSMHTVNCSKIEKELCEKVEKTEGPVVFDLQEVKYIASTFLRICTRVYKKAGPEKFSIINVSSDLMNVFQISGLDRFIDVK